MGKSQEKIKSSRRDAPMQLVILRRPSLFLITLNFLACTSPTGALVKLPPNAIVPAIIALGDSIVDSGNNNDLKTPIKCNFPPYGKDFKGGIPTGRFCDGRVPSDIIAEELGIKDVVPAYLDPSVAPQELLTGVTFASGGSGFDPLTPQLALAISLSDQLEYFKQHIGKLKALAGENVKNSILTNSLFLVVAGSDDIANTYFPHLARRLQYDVPAYTYLMITFARTFLQELYELGARRIAVFSAAPVGCLTFQRTSAGGANRQCAENLNQSATLFNSKLSPLLDNLTNSLPNSKFVYVDICTPLLNLIQNPSNYGFKVVDKGCCGT